VVLATVIVAALIAGGFGAGILVADRGVSGTQPIAVGAKVGPTTSQGPQPTTPMLPGNDDEPAAAVASALGPAVVEVDVTTGASEGLGSGVVYDQSGLILTNAHVVNGTKSVTVRFAAGRDNLTVARLAADAPKVGEMAIGIGSPFGLQETVTAGIVSAVDRPVAGEDGGTTTNMIQTDAPINPGNSGGPLADLQGRVIGINDQIESESGSSSGVGFAIPIDTAKAVADKLVAGQPVTFAFLGVQTQDSGQGVVGNGALIVSVESGSPAEKAGLQQGDVITKVDGTTIDDATTLSARIRQSTPGTVLHLSVERNNAAVTVTVTLGSTSAT
jgi:putative serine protease PepD